MRIIYMGTPDFAVPALVRLIDEGYEPTAVVTGQDKQRGRGRKVSTTPVKRVANLHKIPVLQPESVRDSEFAAEIVRLEPDLIVVVAFRILPPEVFEAAGLGAFNLHASLLPRFRGAAPIQRALMEGVKKTGVTTFLLKTKVDTGNILLQEHVNVGPDETAGDLHDRLASLGADVVLETVRTLEAGTVQASEQDETMASPAPKITKEDCHIDWSMTSVEVHNHIRALSPDPGAWTNHGDVRVKIFGTSLTHRDAGADPGTVIEVADQLEVACGVGSIEITDLQREGRGRMAASEFLNGYEIRLADRLT